MKNGKVMINTPPGKAHGDDDRGLDMAQGLVEIGAVLFADPDLAVGRNAGKGLGRHTVKITDDGRHGDIGPVRQFSTSVRRDAGGGQGDRVHDIRDRRLPTAQQGDRVKTVNNLHGHGFLMHFSETDHNVAAK